MELGKIDVVATTPLPGLGTPLSHVPANAQVFTAPVLGGQRAASLPAFLERNAAGVATASGQGNPFQPDMSYRGFVASPLLGVPQGLSVFQDGVRINEPFGDVVNWDLLPQAAIASVQLIPGSNPAFGPNTLGGALALYTKSGAQYPGGALEAQDGSYGRGALQFEQGGSRDAWHYFATGNLLRERGWAAHNPTQLNQFFAKVGYQTDRADLDVSLTAADNVLHGAQTLPRSFLDDIRQPYTYPDRSANRLAFITAKGSRFVGDDALLGAAGYFRHYRNASFASNVNGDFGNPMLGGGVDDVQAFNDRASIDQESHGVGLQLTLPATAAGRENRLVVGASVDFGRARFIRDSQPAAFTDSRGTVATREFERVTDAKTESEHFGAFVSDSLSAGHWVLTVSARANLARVRIADESGSEPLLNGVHHFSRVNPAVGINFLPSESSTSYVAYSESMRAPTPIELTCADPGAPCKLPNNFLADPPLNAVIARTVEAGARGKRDDTAWSAAVYRTELADDIQFVSGGGASTATGFFRNVGRTWRQGIEITVQKKWGAAELAARYSYVDATFRSTFRESSPRNSSADAHGAIVVSPGDRMPGIPQRSFRLSLGYGADSAWSVGLVLACSSAIFARGDENNRDAGGRVPGYAVVNAHARWRPVAGTEIFALVDNLLDQRYANVGILGQNFFASPARTFAGANVVNEQFRGSGPPRGIWVGIRHEWR